MYRRRALSRIGGAALAVSAGLPGVVGATPGGNKGRGQSSIVVPDDYATIQTAVDAASTGETVVVDGGIYREQVVINKDLTLLGQNGARIEAPPGMTTFSLAESGSAWAPMVFAYGGELSGGTISGSGAVDVSVSGFELDGRGDTGQAGRKTAVLYRNVGSGRRAAITENTVRNLGVPGGSIGLVAYGDSRVAITENELHGFGRGGIGANGDGGAHPAPSVLIRDNVIDAEASPGGSAPNGVQIGYGATAEVQGNTIRNCRWTASADATWLASGILVFESDGIRVQGNTVENSDVAIAASAWGWFADSASNNKITRNEITDALIGVNLRCTAWGSSNQQPSMVNNKVVNNTITDSAGGPAGTVGISVEQNDESTDFDPVVENNKLIRNTITGFDTQISTEGSTTKIQAIQP